MAAMFESKTPEYAVTPSVIPGFVSHTHIQVVFAEQQSGSPGSEQGKTQRQKCHRAWELDYQDYI